MTKLEIDSETKTINLDYNGAGQQIRELSI